ncbi:MAG: hypothetical protein AMXMBFR7_06160 [Planctomycetota bacterium]
MFFRTEAQGQRPWLQLHLLPLLLFLFGVSAWLYIAVRIDLQYMAIHANEYTLCAWLGSGFYYAAGYFETRIQRLENQRRQDAVSAPNASRIGPSQVRQAHPANSSIPAPP